MRHTIIINIVGQEAGVRYRTRRRTISETDYRTAVEVSLNALARTAIAKRVQTGRDVPSALTEIVNAETWRNL